MRTWCLFVLATFAAIIGVATLHDQVPAAVSAGLNALVIMGSGVAAKTISTRRRRARRADRADSVEHEYEAAAAVACLQVIFVLLATAGLGLLLVEEFLAAAALYGTTVLAVAAYWLAYANARRRA